MRLPSSSSTPATGPAVAVSPPDLDDPASAEEAVAAVATVDDVAAPASLGADVVVAVEEDVSASLSSELPIREPILDVTASTASVTGRFDSDGAAIVME